MTRTTYRFATDMPALSTELNRLGFIQKLSGVDATDTGSVYEALSDLIWYPTRWENGLVPFRGVGCVGYHPITDAMDIYMECTQNHITICVPSTDIVSASEGDPGHYRE